MYLGREIITSNNYNSSALTEAIPSQKQHSFNDFYLTYKKENNLELEIENQEITFKDGKAYIGSEPYEMDDKDFYLEGIRFAMDENGRLFISNEKTSNHSGILGGQYVICAGTIQFDENGQIVTITNSTGHYGSVLSQLQMAVKILDAKKAFARDAAVYSWDSNEFITIDEFINKKLETETMLQTAKEVQELGENFTLAENLPAVLTQSKTPYTKTALSYARKKIDIMQYKYTLIYVESKIRHAKMGIEPIDDLAKLEEKFKQLKQNIPHPEIYDEVLALQASFQISAHAHPN